MGAKTKAGGTEAVKEKPQSNELEFLRQIKVKLEREGKPLTRKILEERGYSKRFIDTVLSA